MALDSKELLFLGARSMVVNLCKQIEEVITAVPELKRFAYSLARESVGMKPAGRKEGGVNGSTRERLASQLVEARSKRRGGIKKGTASPAYRALMSKKAKARWAEARRLGISTNRLPKTTELAKGRSKAAAKSKPKAAAKSDQPNGGAPAAE
jgi:hypothetical protein